MEITKGLLIPISHNLMENILLVMDVKEMKDGYYWITGRVDDVIIVSGHNLGTAEIESAFVCTPKSLQKLLWLDIHMILKVMDYIVM